MSPVYNRARFRVSDTRSDEEGGSGDELEGTSRQDNESVANSAIPASSPSYPRYGNSVEDEGEDEVDIDDDNEDEDANENDGGEAEEENDEEDEIVSADEEPAVSEGSNSPLPQQPRLKIKLKLPLPASSASGTATPAPEDIRSSGRRPRLATARSRQKAQEMDLDSPDEEEEEDEFEDDAPSRSTPSSLAAGPSTSSARARAMTTRQAVLASTIESAPLTPADENPPQAPTAKGKKKQLNENEIALRREETARKRRNLTEKKLEDEKAETINRLLKKQSRPKTKRAAAAAAATATGGPPTPVPSKLRDDTAASNAGDDDAMEVEDEGVLNQTTPAAPLAPMMYRWISTSRPLATGTDNTNPSEPKMTLSFSVPPSLFPQSGSRSSPEPELASKLPVQPKPSCDFENCCAERKYRLVKDWTRGACGMGHLKALESSMDITV